MTVHEAAELVSLILSSPTVIGAIAIVILWGRPVYDNERKVGSSRNWMMLGIMIAFGGEAVDNIYWGVAWSAEYLSAPSAPWWFSNGVYSNIPFRQTAGMIATYCHLRAFCEITKSPVRALRVMHVAAWASIALGCTGAIVLWLVKHG